FVTSQGSADDAGQEGPLEGADAGLWQKDRNGFNFLAEISMTKLCKDFAASQRGADDAGQEGPLGSTGKMAGRPKGEKVPTQDCGKRPQIFVRFLLGIGISLMTLRGRRPLRILHIYLMI
ncbi:MAG: hypothetical protein FWE42_03865, partial [Defluviitaleaceae bacterium]|nr:hypothetical protein [Defluviitaleaceae bacterium]